jgi:hypothetical protein
MGPLWVRPDWKQFKAFWAVTKRYAELTRSDPLIHRSVAEAVNGLTDSPPRGVPVSATMSISQHAQSPTTDAMGRTTLKVIQP